MRRVTALLLFVFGNVVAALAGGKPINPPRFIPVNVPGGWTTQAKLGREIDEAIFDAAHLNHRKPGIGKYILDTCPTASSVINKPATFIL